MFKDYLQHKLGLVLRNYSEELSSLGLQRDLSTIPLSLRISAAWGSLLTIGLFFIFLALSAYLIVLKVSSMLESAGLTQAIITV